MVNAVEERSKAALWSTVKFRERADVVRGSTGGVMEKAGADVEIAAVVMENDGLGLLMWVFCSIGALELLLLVQCSH